MLGSATTEAAVAREEPQCCWAVRDRGDTAQGEHPQLLQALGENWGSQARGFLC